MATPPRFDDHDAPRLTGVVQALIATNIAILFLQWSVVSDADMAMALGVQSDALQRMPWTAVSYMFVHASLWHLALNMYALYSFGPRLAGAMGSRGFALYYVWCGLGGAMAQLLFVRSGVLVGASAGVLGVMFGYAQQWPNEEVALLGIVPMRAWTMVVLFAAANLLLGMLDPGSAAATTSPGAVERLAYLAHLGGLAFGWLYLRTPPAASLERLRQRISPAPDYVDDAPRPIPRTMPRARAQRDEVDEIVAKSRALSAPRRPVPRPALLPARAGDDAATEVDRVLDKISSEGLASLTLEERAVLDEMAQRLRSGR